MRYIPNILVGMITQSSLTQALGESDGTLNKIYILIKLIRAPLEFKMT